MMGMAAAFSPRTLILLVLALLLGGALYWDSAAPSLLADQTALAETESNSLWQQGRQLKDKIANLRYWAAHKDNIQTAYFQNAAVYADRMVDRAVITASGTPPTADLVENMLREKLNGFAALDDVKLAVGAEANDPAIFTADVGFSSGSSAEALMVVTDFAYPPSGSAWQQLTVTTDRTTRRVVVSGRLQILASEAAE